MVAKKDTHAPKHPELETIPNLQVMKAMNSLKSRGYVKEQFAWRHYYWYLTNEGIRYLRDYLHLPPEIVPSTLKKSARPDPRPRASAGPRSFGGDKPQDGRGEYRRTGGAGADKAADAGAGSAGMQFVSSKARETTLDLIFDICFVCFSFAEGWIRSWQDGVKSTFSTSIRAVYE